MKTALLLFYVSVFRRPLQHKIVLFENTSSLWAETTREKKNNEKAAIRSHKRASQAGNCGSVLVCNVNKGTHELKKTDTGNYLSIKYCKFFASVALWRILWMLRANFRRT